VALTYGTDAMEIHLHGPYDHSIARALEAAFETQHQHVTQILRRIMATLDEVLAKVRENTTQIGSLNTLLDGLRQQVADVMSGARLPQAVQDKVNAIFDAAGEQSAAIVDTINENTPQAPPPTP
jgi:hypothetical protein